MKKLILNRHPQVRATLHLGTNRLFGNGQPVKFEHMKKPENNMKLVKKMNQTPKT